MTDTWALGTFSHDGERFPALVVDARAHDLRGPLGAGTTTNAMLQSWEASSTTLTALVDGELGAGTPVGELHPEAPIDPPGQVLLAGANYHQHLNQMLVAFERRDGSELPDDELRANAEAFTADLAANGTPFVFAGLPSALCGAHDDVVLFGPGSDHDWELELAVVIGKPAWRVPRERAMEHVAGYTMANDVSTRDVMNRPGFPMTDFIATKFRPTFLPAGPYLLPAQFVPDPGDLQVTPSVNGEAMQDESTSDMIFGVDRLIEYASTLTVLRPGDLLLTGSPAGNAAHHGNRWLRPGDVMDGTITGLGAQRNRCVAESEFRPLGV